MLSPFLNFHVSPQHSIVNRYQARQALILAGLFNQVQPIIDAIQDSTERMLMQAAWDDAPNFRRDDPFLMKIAEALNLTDAALDSLFTTAAGL